MISQYGMSDDFDMVAMESINNKYLGGDASLACSDTTASQIDQQVVALIKKQHDKAKKLLEDHREDLDRIANYLYEKETITGEEFMDILDHPENYSNETEVVDAEFLPFFFLKNFSQICKYFSKSFLKIIDLVFSLFYYNPRRN